MAPRKEKPEKVSANEAADTILNYLPKILTTTPSSRPYSATDISANLHNKVTKATATKILKDLHDRNEISGRASGKQLIYHALQPPSDATTPELLTTLTSKTATLTTSTAALAATAKTLRTALLELTSTLSTAELVASLRDLEAEKRDIEARLAVLRQGDARVVRPEERAEVEGEWRKWSAAAKRRGEISRRMWRDIEGVLGEEEERGEVRERLGLDD
ncbi:Tat binding protein 1-interacting [Corynespora cassiicola Philippines]|uniref:Tat binding protein 1-interacting n=1 Tax=Corynespora cassiicola Philippines TaxID=1448308 RepID=A0A2T2NBS5_CORCC|nr:Tat binding protein 1-interacting [Corynespora cassiicola Philippines]